MANDNSLEKARQEINSIDARMRELFIERMRAAEAVAAYKAERGLAIYDAEREEEVVRRNSEEVGDDTLREYYVNFIRSNMAVSRAYQSRLMKGLRVSYSGTVGAFAHIATEKIFPEAIKVSYPDFTSAYRAVESGECDVAVLPVENSYIGEVAEVTDLIFSGTLYINRTYELPVTQDLVGIPGATVKDVREVISHPQALAQCAGYIKSHGFVEKEFANTALAAKRVAELGDRSVAAIASAEAAEIFGLAVLDHGINESKGNTTRFAVLSRIPNKGVGKGDETRSVLLFTVGNTAGALARAINVIGSHGYNMRILRSRPMKETNWEYYFYVEVEGGIDTDEGRAMFKELDEYCDKLKFAGTYITD